MNRLQESMKLLSVALIASSGILSAGIDDVSLRVLVVTLCGMGISISSLIAGASFIANDEEVDEAEET